MNKNSGIFVTGTDTGIGKTVVSAALMNALREKRENICYWKPIQTGIEEDNDTKTVEILADCSEEEIFDKGFRLAKPLSPHLSAKLANVEISVEKILNFTRKDWSASVPACNERKARKSAEMLFWIIEGAGGILVPLNENELMIDLMKSINLPVLIVAHSSLGTINHTLLTIENLRNRNLQILGVVLNGEPNEENKRAIEHFGKVSVLAEMPKFEKLNFKNLKKWSENNLCRL